ncbi:MAG TPA: CHRD domain-containing protein [Gammaproteobacteria bacterium]|nr:CHRD domain-containing protein [Gammaproteobacteria bacterium]
MATKQTKPRSQPRKRVAAIIAALAFAATPAVARAAETFTVRLTPVPIDAQTRAQVTGSGAATAVLDGRSLAVTGSFAGLKTAATIARLHEGRATGVRGPGIVDFTVPAASSGDFTLQLQLSPQQLQSLRQGRLYIQIHSDGAPDGNLWGWLLQ